MKLNDVAKHLSMWWFQETETCVTGRYCWMEDFKYFWAYKQGATVRQFISWVWVKPFEANLGPQMLVYV